MSNRQATEQDFRYPEFRGKDPNDYEVRPDGKCVRKDRWENGIRSIASILGFNSRDGFEIEDVVAKVAELHNGTWKESHIETETCRAYYQHDVSAQREVFARVIEYFKSNNAFSGESIHQRDDPMMDAPSVMADIADNILKFDVIDIS